MIAESLIRSGRPITTRTLRTMADQNSVNIIGGDGILIDRTKQGLIITADRRVPEPAQRIRARITDATPIGANRWEYDLVRVRLEENASGSLLYPSIADSQFVALNYAELTNSANGVQGNGIELPLPDGFSIAPAPAGRIIWCDAWMANAVEADDILSRRWFFDFNNAVVGECPPP